MAETTVYVTAGPPMTRTVVLPESGETTVYVTAGLPQFETPANAWYYYANQ